MNVRATIIRGAEVYAPENRGVQDVCIFDGRIAALAPSLPDLPPEIPHEVVNAKGAKLTPGLIDSHVHLSGGGGEAGPETRVPPLALSELTRYGVTSCVGVLGTDGTTRTVRDLVAQTMGLRRLGVSAYCYTGSYQYPVPTLTGSIRDDIVFVDPIIGVGELAISDHRSSQLTLDEFLRVASDTYTAGLISGKAGVLHIHMGDGEREFELIEAALSVAEIPARVYHPTHINRQSRLFESAKTLSRGGVTVDVTAFPDAGDGYLASEAIDRWFQSGQDERRITCSSDGGGCLPIFDEDGELMEMDVGRSSVLLQTIRELLNTGYTLDRILPCFTTNVARVLRLSNVGRVAPGMVADLLVLDDEGEVAHVMCRGQWVVRDGVVTQHGIFEDR